MTAGCTFAMRCATLTWCLFTLALLLLLRQVVLFEQLTASFCRTARLHAAWNVSLECVVEDDVFVWSSVPSSGAYCRFAVRCLESPRHAVSSSDVFQTNDTLICAPKSRAYVNRTLPIRFAARDAPLGEIDSPSVLRAAMAANQCDTFEYALEPLVLLGLPLSLAACVGLPLRVACVQRRVFQRKRAAMRARRRQFGAGIDDLAADDIDDGFSVQLLRR
jgi:hypothetical protein